MISTINSIVAIAMGNPKFGVANIYMRAHTNTRTYGYAHIAYVLCIDDPCTLRGDSI